MRFFYKDGFMKTQIPRNVQVFLKDIALMNHSYTVLKGNRKRNYAQCSDTHVQAVLCCNQKEIRRWPGFQYEFIAVKPEMLFSSRQM